MLAQLAAFVGVAVVVICTPGPDTALTIRNTLVGGRRTGVMTAAGVAMGQAVWTIAASAGVVAILRASEPAFLALRLAGAVYLVLLGVHSIRLALTGRAGGPAPSARRPRLRSAAAMRQGLLSNLGNPKMAVFFTSLLPQFAPTGRAAFLVLVGLGLLFCLMTLGWLSAYAVAVSKARRALGRTAVRRALDALAGFVLVGLGIRLAAERS